MRGWIAAVALVLVGLAGQADAAELDGTWTATAAERDGAPAPDLVGHRLTFAGEGFEIVAADGGLVFGGTYRTDPSAAPPAIDFVQGEGEAEGVEWLGVYRLEGDALTIADNAPDPTRPRPTDFTAPAGSGYVVLEFARDGS